MATKPVTELDFDSIVARATKEAELCLGIVCAGGKPPTAKEKRVWMHAFKEGFKWATRARVVER